MEENRTKTIKEGLLSGLLLVITVLVICISSYLFQLETADIIRNGVISGISMGMVIFLRALSRTFGEYDYDNGEHSTRFWVCFLFGLLMAVVCANLPIAGWPYVAIFVLLSLFSNTLIGIVAASILLLFTLLLSGGAFSAFVLYFISGLTGAFMFKKLDENFRIGIPLMVTLLVLLVCETANVVLYVNERFSFELFLIPLMNVVISGVLLVIILKLFSAMVTYRYRDKYMEINAQECRLLVQLKEHSKEEYYKAVHSAYFCDRIARKLVLDVDAAKAGGYYCRIGQIYGTKTWEDVAKICKECEFPPKAQEVLQEVVDKKKVLVSKEAAVVLCADAVVSTILFLFTKNGDAPLDYDKVIDAVFRKKMESGIFNGCEMSMKEINQMKKIFKEEKLYYDFLR